MEEVWVFLTPQVHICLAFEEIKWHANQQIITVERQGGGNNCLNMPQLALNQYILIHPVHTCVSSLCS